jgi:hypothetical protein
VSEDSSWVLALLENKTYVNLLFLYELTIRRIDNTDVFRKLFNKFGFDIEIFLPAFLSKFSSVSTSLNRCTAQPHDPNSGPALHGCSPLSECPEAKSNVLRWFILGGNRPQDIHAQSSHD